MASSKNVNVQALFDACSALELPELLNMVQLLQTRLVKRLENERSTLLLGVKTSRDKLQQERKEWEALANKLNQVQLPEYIRLNVGGVVFASSRANLQKYENTFFSALLSGRWEANLKEDVFIDRSPTLFGRVIDFLRGDKTITQDLTDLDRERLAIEADFYQLDELKRLCRYLEPIQGGLELLNGKRTIKISPDYRISNRPYVAAVRPAYSFPLTAEFIEQSFEITAHNGYIYFALCNEFEINALRTVTTSPTLHTLGIKMEVSSFVGPIQNLHVFTVRLYNDLRLQWRIRTKSNPNQEINCAEVKINPPSSQLALVVVFLNTTAQVDLC